MALHYYIGSALEPIKKPAVICHICNDKVRWGSGFVIAVSEVNPEPERQYNAWGKLCKGNLPLGESQVIQIDDDVWVVNMIAQHDTIVIDGIPPLRIEALRCCLTSVNTFAKEKGATVHAPRIGAVRSGGRWEDIEKLILSTLTVDTYIYTLEIEKDMWATEYDNDKGSFNGEL
jgi:hypothetical protein